MSTTPLPLPPEITEHALSYCHPRAVSAFARTCSGARQIVYGSSDTYLWRNLWISYPLDDPRQAVNSPHEYPGDDENIWAWADGAHMVPDKSSSLEAPFDWIAMTQAVVGAERLLNSFTLTSTPDAGTAPTYVPFVSVGSAITSTAPARRDALFTLLRLFALSTPGPLSAAPSYNVLWLRSHLTRDSPLLTVTGQGGHLAILFDGETPPPPGRETEIPPGAVTRDERTRARMIVYDLRNWTRANRWGPYIAQPRRTLPKVRRARANGERRPKRLRIGTIADEDVAPGPVPPLLDERLPRREGEGGERDDIDVAYAREQTYDGDGDDSDDAMSDVDSDGEFGSSDGSYVPSDREDVGSSSDSDDPAPDADPPPPVPSSLESDHVAHLRVSYALLRALRSVVRANLDDLPQGASPRPPEGLDAGRPYSAAGLEAWAERYREGRLGVEYGDGGRWRDWAGVSGTWRRYVCFMDYRDLFAFNYASIGQGPRAPDFFEDDAFQEATRLIDLHLELVPDPPSASSSSAIGSSASTFNGIVNGNASYMNGDGNENGKGKGKAHGRKKRQMTAQQALEARWPPLRFRGRSRGVHGNEATVDGVVRMGRDGVVRWSFTRKASTYDGHTMWSSEGVQLGSVGSAAGVVGAWTGAQHDRGDPVGPFWLWKVADDPANGAGFF